MAGQQRKKIFLFGEMEYSNRQQEVWRTWHQETEPPQQQLNDDMAMEVSIIRTIIVEKYYQHEIWSSRLLYTKPTTSSAGVGVWK